MSSHIQNDNIPESEENEVYDTMKIGSFNIRGAKTAPKVEALCCWGELKEMDIIGIQETNMTRGATAKLFKNGNRHTDKHDYYHIFWGHGDEGETQGSGVALLLSPFWRDHIQRQVAFKGRAQAVDFHFKTGFKIRIINIYLSSRNDNCSEAVVAWIKTEYSDRRN
jgi:exonuclease III